MTKNDVKIIVKKVIKEEVNPKFDQVYSEMKNMKEELTESFTTGIKSVKEELTESFTTEIKSVKKELTESFTTEIKSVKKELTESFKDAVEIMREDFADNTRIYKEYVDIENEILNLRIDDIERKQKRNFDLLSTHDIKLAK